MTKHSTATGYTVSDEWQTINKKIDWMSAPLMAEYVNGMVSSGEHWAAYARNKYVLPFSNLKKLSMVSIACGSAWIEESLLTQFNWPISRLIGLEYDDNLRRIATEKLLAIKSCECSVKFFDFNDFHYSGEQFDIVFACHSLHHSNDIEGLIQSINSMVKPDGLILGIDFFGPTRFQIEYDVLPIIQELYSYLPDNLKRNLRTADMQVENLFKFDNFEAVGKYDISEAVRSSDLRTLLFSTFPIVEIKPMCGTILRWLLQNRAGNFKHENPEHLTIIRLLQFIERELILSKQIRSDDLFYCLRKSERL